MGLTTARYLSLVTWKRDGTEVPTPVWFAAEGEVLYVFTAAASGKVKRLRNNPAIKVAPCGVLGALKGDWQSGQAVILSDGKQQQRAHSALRRRYGWQMILTDWMSKLSGRYHKRAWLELRLDSLSH